jgi:hypothetical protein
MLIESLTFISLVEKERLKAEKTQKFAMKKQLSGAIPAVQATSKTKEKKAKQDASKDPPLPEYVEETPPGEKKSTSPQTRPSTRDETMLSTS